MMLPVIEGSLRHARLTNNHHSCNDTVLESWLGIPDPTPADDSDDVEPVLQIVRTEEYLCLYVLNDTFTQVISGKPASPLQTRLATYVLDVIVPPPQA